MSDFSSIAVTVTLDQASIRANENDTMVDIFATLIGQIDRNATVSLATVSSGSAQGKSKLLSKLALVCSTRSL